MKTRRVFASLPADRWLTDSENEVKWAIVDAIEKLGYVTEIFFDPRGSTSIAASKAWSAAECESVMRRCDGCALLGFARWRLRERNADVGFATDFNHYEGAVAYTLRLPIFSLVQEGVEREGHLRRIIRWLCWRSSFKRHPFAGLPTKALRSPSDTGRNNSARVATYFSATASTSAKTAAKVKRHLKTELQLTVHDWASDFDPARTILQQIEEASRTCGAGIFLFTRDDLLNGKKTAARAVPRDNVVFEAGYFSSVKGKSRVLIVLEAGAKMPADLGGDIYASLERRDKIGSIKPVLRQFAAAL